MTDALEIRLWESVIAQAIDIQSLIQEGWEIRSLKRDSPFPFTMPDQMILKRGESTVVMKSVRDLAEFLAKRELGIES